MQAETLRDVLDWTINFHRELSQCLSQGAKIGADERSGMLLDYLAQHENSLKKVVTRIEQETSKNALDTWCYEYLEKYPVTRNQHCTVAFGDLNASQIVEVVMEYHHQVIELYRFLHAKAPTDDTRELLDALCQLEEHEAMSMAQGANRLEDM
ncbi:hypothetical protein [Hahella ganghwensis]|uniref:hypothetical protein n=1 Tax=Hahella ganghwensis TaxID=286420 RepID=UPI00037329BB|nr:hypothetical protein [Hahella ganghwensis]